MAAKLLTKRKTKKTKKKVKIILQTCDDYIGSLINGESVPLKDAFAVDTMSILK